METDTLPEGAGLLWRVSIESKRNGNYTSTYEFFKTGSRFQSNLRGMETGSRNLFALLKREFQSNLRGMETEDGAEYVLEQGVYSFNRI